MVPAGRYERVYEAARRGQHQLAPEVAAQLGALFEPETLFALGVLVGVWALTQLTPVGPFADVALLFYSGVGLLKQLWGASQDLYAWVTGASAAKTDEDLEAAGGHFARAVVTIGVEALLAVISVSAFKALKAKIRKEPGRFRSGEPLPAEVPGERPPWRMTPEEEPGPWRGPPEGEPPPSRAAAEPEPARRPAPSTYVYVAGMALPAAQAFGKDLTPQLPTGPLVVGGVVVGVVVLTAVGVAVARSRHRG